MSRDKPTIVVVNDEIVIWMPDARVFSVPADYDRYRLVAAFELGIDYADVTPKQRHECKVRSYVWMCGLGRQSERMERTRCLNLALDLMSGRETKR